MSTKILNKFVLAAGFSLVLGLSADVIAQTSICHHPPGLEHHNNDTLVENGEGHFGPGHTSDHPPVEGSCQLTGGTGDPVPEPITMLLFGAGLAGVGYAAKRRKQRAQ